MGSKSFLFKIIPLLVFFCILNWANASDSDNGLNVGDKVLPFNANDQNGELWKLENYLGKNYMIFYYHIGSGRVGDQTEITTSVFAGLAMTTFTSSCIPNHESSIRKNPQFPITNSQFQIPDNYFFSNSFNLSSICLALSNVGSTSSALL